MGSFVSWLDHSEADQRRVREMLQLFSERDTVDDLGIGTVRDTISNALFPGTSVIQTRARYFLFIPWIFRRAEEKHAPQLVAKASDLERRLIEALKAGGDLEGLIGREAGTNVRTLPSAIFWGGLIRYGIFLAPGLSIRQYGRQAARGIPNLDPEDEIGDRAPSFWNRDIPDPPEDFFRFESADFDLTRAESAWLCERVISSDGIAAQPSLLTAYVREIQRGESGPDADAFWHTAIPSSTPTAIREIIPHAAHFSIAVQGAAVLYNLMLAEQRAQSFEITPATDPVTYRDLLDDWTNAAEATGVGTWAKDPSAFWSALARHRSRIPMLTKGFVDRWAAMLADSVDITDDPTARELVRAREFEHKKAQARLTNAKRLAEWGGYAGTSPLTYRWGQVQRMLRDLSNGLDNTTETPNAVA